MSQILRPVALAVSLAVAFCVGLISQPAHSDVSFKGKTLTIVINSSPGGGTDGFARLVGPILVEYLPGTPSIVFRNLPGGGGVKANNYFYNRVAPDGLTALVGSRTQISPTKLRSKAVRYRPDEYYFVGGSQRLGTIIVGRKDQLSRLMNPSAKPLVYGDVDGQRSGIGAVAWAKEYLGWNVRFILGYGGTAALELAARRGEIDLVANSDASHVAAMVKDGLQPIAQLGARGENDSRVARAAYPNVPIFDSMILPKLSGKALKAYRAWIGDQLVDKWLALPPKTPADIVRTYRAAFDKVAKNPGFVDVTTRQYGEQLPLYSGAAVNAIVKELVQTDDDDLTFLINLKKKHGLIGQNVRMAKIALLKHTGPVTRIKRGGRQVWIRHKGKEVKTKISGSRTKVTIGGKAAKRKAIKVGMTCTFTYPRPGAESKNVDCK